MVLSRVVKVDVEVPKCVGHGVCEGLTPGVFEVGDDGFVEVRQDAVPGTDPALLRQAVAACPNSALSIED